MSDMDNRVVVALDPGGTTGIAIRLPLDPYQYLTCTASSPEELYAFLKKTNIGVLIVENFMAQMIGKYGLHTVRIVGGAYFYACDREIEYVLHTPQNRYPFLPDAKKILLGRQPRPVIHEVDALAHLLRWEYDTNESR